MNEDSELNIFRCLDFLRDQAPAYARAKANRVYLEEYRKSLKAIIMKEVEPKYPSSAAQEREAYADERYLQLLLGLKDAVGEEERLRWLIVGAQAKIEVWRSLESSRRTEQKIIP